MNPEATRQIKNPFSFLRTPFYTAHSRSFTFLPIRKKVHYLRRKIYKRIAALFSRKRLSGLSQNIPSVFILLKRTYIIPDNSLRTNIQCQNSIQQNLQAYVLPSALNIAVLWQALHRSFKAHFETMAATYSIIKTNRKTDVVVAHTVGFVSPLIFWNKPRGA